MTHTNTEAVSDEAEQALADRAWWRQAGEALGLELRGWTFRDNALFVDMDTGRSVDLPGSVAERLSRRAANAGGVEVKGLKWEGDFAHTGMGLMYHIDHNVPGFVVLEKIEVSGTTKSGWPSVEAAQAHADEHWRGLVLSAISLAVEAEPVAPTERLKLHRKIMGMIADKQRYAGVMIDGRELRVIAEALLDRAIEVERSSPVSAEVTEEKIVASAMRLCAKAEEAYGFMDMSSNESKENWANFCEAKSELLKLSTAALATLNGGRENG